MVDEFEGKHELVQLLITRMRAHPEEFRGYPYASSDEGNRWGYLMHRVREALTGEDWAVVETELRGIQLDALKDEFLDELMNGDERRRQYEAQAQAHVQAMQAQTQALRSQAQVLRSQTAQEYLAGAAPTLGGYASQLRNAATPLAGAAPPAQLAAKKGFLKDLLKGE